MGRAPCCDKDSLKKGPWTPEEDQKLLDYIQQHGHGSWRTLPKIAGLARCGKSCRLRWANYLRPDIKRGRFSFEEEEAIIQLHGVLGNKWSAIAARLPGRTDNEIKNYWNTHIRKRLLRMGIDPVTHSPRLDHLSPILGSSLCNSNYQLNLSNLIGIEPLINSELIRLATSILSNSTSSQNIQTHQNSNLLAQYSQQNQLQNSLQLQNTVYSNLQSSATHSPVQNQSLALQYPRGVTQMPNNADMFTQTAANLNDGSQCNIAQTSQWPAGGINDSVMSSIDYNQIISPMITNDCLYNLSNNAADQLEDFMNAISVMPNNPQPGTSTDHPDLRLIGSVSTTTSSSKLKSPPATYMNGSVSTTPSSTYNNDNTDQDDKDSYVCSSMNLLKFQIPDLLDFDDFIMCPTHTS